MRRQDSGGYSLRVRPYITDNRLPVIPPGHGLVTGPVTGAGGTRVSGITRARAGIEGVPSGRMPPRASGAGQDRASVRCGRGPLTANLIVMRPRVAAQRT